MFRVCGYNEEHFVITSVKYNMYICTMHPAPNVMSVNAERLNMTSFNITTSLLYTGGSDITHFSVSFWKRNRTEWSDGLSVEAHASGTGMGLDWFGIMTSDGLAEPSELRVVVVNDVGHRSSPQTVQEKLGENEYSSTYMYVYMYMYMYPCCSPVHVRSVYLFQPSSPFLLPLSSFPCSSSPPHPLPPYLFSQLH